jgi:hypothetical protein
VVHVRDNGDISDRCSHMLFGLKEKGCIRSLTAPMSP